MDGGREVKGSPWGEPTKFTHVSLYWKEVVGYKGGRVRMRLRGEKFGKEGYSVVRVEVD